MAVLSTASAFCEVLTVTWSAHREILSKKLRVEAIAKTIVGKVKNVVLVLVIICDLEPPVFLLANCLVENFLWSKNPFSTDDVRHGPVVVEFPLPRNPLAHFPVRAVAVFSWLPRPGFLRRRASLDRHPAPLNRALQVCMRDVQMGLAPPRACLFRVIVTENVFAM